MHRAAGRQTGSDLREWVELVGAYSNHPDLANTLVSTAQQLHEAQARQGMDAPTVSSTGRSPQLWRVADRLNEDEIRLLIAAFMAGTPKVQLAKQYGISLSSVKRLLRKHRESLAS
ncbi:helix-turn-helix domain-containing protein [Fodinicola acaciae]|uniref:helix-turn-helix domain-containing protein n=1 Tax=Fodinicola acaciae TaxID=2681555 RepID=UPI0013D1C8A2|nr:helix-turn-helix domain-containing protein [Fodinicola acaciae]